ncbi:advanced glycosylation end product-specific receptor isoform 1-T1 [Callospermophilus lateralis]
METGKQGPVPIFIETCDSLHPHHCSIRLSQRTGIAQALLCLQNTGRTEAWKILSPQGSPWDSVARVLPNGSLLLPAIGIQDEGTFRCRATNRHGKETKSNYRVRVYQIPGKPEIIDPASELMAGVPNKVGTCVSEGSYPEGTLSWHLDGKPLIPDGKGVSVKEQIRRNPETGLFTLQSELMVTPARGGNAHPTFSCSFSPGIPRRRALNTAPIQPSVWEPVPLEEVRLVVEPEGGAVVRGGTVTLTCEAPAQPPPQIHWVKDGLRTRGLTVALLHIPAMGPRKALLSASALQVRPFPKFMRPWAWDEGHSRLQLPIPFWHYPQELSYPTLNAPTPRSLPHPNPAKRTAQPLSSEPEGKTPLSLPPNSPFPN